MKKYEKEFAVLNVLAGSASKQDYMQGKTGYKLSCYQYISADEHGLQATDGRALVHFPAALDASKQKLYLGKKYYPNVKTKDHTAKHTDVRFPPIVKVVPNHIGTYGGYEEKEIKFGVYTIGYLKSLAKKSLAEHKGTLKSLRPLIATVEFDGVHIAAKYVELIAKTFAIKGKKDSQVFAYSFDGTYNAMLFTAVGLDRASKWQLLGRNTFAVVMPVKR